MLGPRCVAALGKAPGAATHQAFLLHARDILKTKSKSLARLGGIAWASALAGICQGARACGGPGLLGPRCVAALGKAPGAVTHQAFLVHARDIFSPQPSAYGSLGRGLSAPCDDGAGANRWPDRLSPPRGIQPLAHEAPGAAIRPTYPNCLAWPQPASQPTDGDDTHRIEIDSAQQNRL